jgi:hypothetical protein
VVGIGFTHHLPKDYTFIAVVGIYSTHQLPKDDLTVIAVIGIGSIHKIPNKVANTSIIAASRLSLS